MSSALGQACANIIVTRIGRVDMPALMVCGSIATMPPLPALSLLAEAPAYRPIADRLIASQDGPKVA